VNTFNELRERGERMERLLRRENTFTKVANLSDHTSLWANSTGRELLRVCFKGTTSYVCVEEGGAR